MNTNLYIVMSWLYNIMVFGGTGWAVFELGHSGWWFLLAMLVSSNTADNVQKILLAEKGIQWKEDD